MPQAAKDWAQADGCTNLSSSRADPGVTVLRYSSCRNGVSVELYTIAGEGHERPGGPAMPASLTTVVGAQSSAVDADRVIWAFFKAHPMP